MSEAVHVHDDSLRSKGTQKLVAVLQVLVDSLFWILEFFFGLAGTI